MSVNTVNSEDPLENLVTKYKNHPSTRTILDKSPNTSFLLRIVSKNDIEKEILNLNVAKGSQDSDIPTKIIEKNSDILFFLRNLINHWRYVSFPLVSKLQTLLLSTKKGIDLTKTTIDQSVFYRISQIF